MNRNVIVPGHWNLVVRLVKLTLPETKIFPRVVKTLSRTPFYLTGIIMFHIRFPSSYHPCTMKFLLRIFFSATVVTAIFLHTCQHGGNWLTVRLARSLQQRIPILTVCWARSNCFCWRSNYQNWVICDSSAFSSSKASTEDSLMSLCKGCYL